ncbi:MAG: peptidylprolyl isomerase [Polaromonas sp.]
MKKHNFKLFAVAAVLSAASALAMAQDIATVNGEPIPKARMDLIESQLKAQLEAAGRTMTPEMQTQLREEVVSREVFMQEAQRLKLDKTKEFLDNMELARQTVLIRSLFDHERKANPVTDADVKAEYDKVAAANKAKEFKVSHILVETEDEAKKVESDLKGGAKFEELATKLSKDPGSGAKGGDLDWVTAASLVPEFSEAMVKLKKGETSQPVKSNFGWHVIRLDDTREAQFPAFDQVKPQIRQQLEQQQAQKYQQGLREKAVVK